jgi:hypothetical protein
VRFDQLTLRIPGDEFRVPFHERLTVLSGIGILERKAMIDSVAGALMGGPQATELVFRDHLGYTVIATCDGGEVVYRHDDGSPARSIADRLGLDAAGLRSVMVITAADLGLLRGSSAQDPPELAEARATLAKLSEELQAALAAKQATDALREELADLDERIRQAEENQARRAYARVLAELEKVRTEAAAIRSTSAGVESDRHLLASADGARDLAAVWKEAASQVAELAANFGERERLDARALEEALLVPENPPKGLKRLLHELDSTERERDELATRLRSLAASRLPEPSHPAVVELARRDQDRLWTAARAIVDTAAALERVSMSLGGLPADNERAEPAVADEIERWHDEVVQAEARVERARRPGLVGATAGVAAAAGAVALLPLVAPVGLVGAAVATAAMLVRPKQRLKKAHEHERRALEKAGASTYLAFHLRRVDAVLDPDARERLELAALEHRMALGRWHEVAGDINPGQAAALEAEVLAYSESLAGLGGAADEIEQLRTALTERAEPAAASARERLTATLAPYGIDDPAMASRLLPHQIDMGRVARLQRRLESAEATERTARAKLDELLRDLGFAEGDLAARVGAFEWAFERASERQRARTSARRPDEIEVDLARLEDEARRLRRPEWASVTPAEAGGPDIDELRARREQTASAYESTRIVLPDVDRIADRHSAVERRVAVLEASAGEDPSATIDVDALRQFLQAKLTSATHLGPDREALPVMVDEAFVRLQGDAKWELLDMVERLSETSQVVYLTDDPYVGAWARRRASAGAITLLEPVTEDA